MQLGGEGTLCNVTLTAPRNMAAPVFLYYELDNFYQNHRRCGSAHVGATAFLTVTPERRECQALNVCSIHIASVSMGKPVEPLSSDMC